MTKKLLKNKFAATAVTLFLAAMAPMQMTAQKKIAYLTRTPKVMDATAATTTTEPILKMFEADSRFAVTVFQDDGTGSSGVNLSQYDLLIIQESFGGADAVLKPAGILGISKLTIPVIYNKTFALRSGRAMTTSAATAADVTDLSITIPASKQSHPLFTGINLTSGSIAIFNSGYSDTGAAGTKSLQKSTGIELTTTGTNLALVTGVAEGDQAIVLNDIPAGTKFGSTAGEAILPSRMFTFSMNFGAICGNNGTNVTADALKLWQNAALILTGQSLGTNENTLADNSVSVSPNPTSGLVTVNSADKVDAITVYDTTGKQVAASKTNSVDLSGQASGVYFLKAQTEKGTSSKKVVVE